jgi:hypothetical protein
MRSVRVSVSATAFLAIVFTARTPAQTAESCASLAAQRPYE